MVPYGGIAGSGAARWPDDLTFDSLGHTYWASRWGGPRYPIGALVRHGPGARSDTMTRLLRAQTKALNVKRSGLGDYQTVLFSPEDAWVAAPDGWIGVARAAPYRVEWIPPEGPAVSGPAIRHAALRISKAEKEFIASGAGGWRGRTSVSLVMVTPGGTGSKRTRAPAPMSAKELLFAKVKAPVNLRDNRWPLIDESGRLWVERSLPFGMKTRVFDVFDRAGKLVDRVELPAGSRLVGFDPHWIYTARLDAEDFEHLQRFPLPGPWPIP